MSAGLVLLAIAAVVVIVVATRREGTYAAEVRDAVTPVTQANRELGYGLGSLGGAGGAAHALALTRSAASAVRGAEATLRVLEPSSSQRAFAAAAKRALARELAYLEAVEAALTRPAKAPTGALAGAEPEARAQLEAVGGDLPSFAASLPTDRTLLRYLESQAQAAGTRSSLRAFDAQVKSLLEQSAPSFQTINEVFRQMQDVAGGGASTMNLAEVESAIGEVIANRDALAASARSLDTPTPLASEARSALGAAFSASLTDDHDIERCLNQANSGGLALIFEGCLNASASDSDAATAAKERFFDVYNRLRASVGESNMRSHF